jgi:hypothetical protein
MQNAPPGVQASDKITDLKLTSSSIPGNIFEFDVLSTVAASIAESSARIAIETRIVAAKTTASIATAYGITFACSAPHIAQAHGLGRLVCHLLA